MQTIRRGELLFGDEGFAPPGAEIVEDTPEDVAEVETARRIRQAAEKGCPLPEFTERADLATYSHGILRRLGEGGISAAEAMALYGVLEKHVGMLAMAKLDAAPAWSKPRTRTVVVSDG